MLASTFRLGITLTSFVHFILTVPFDKFRKALEHISTFP